MPNYIFVKAANYSFMAVTVIKNWHLSKKVFTLSLVLLTLLIGSQQYPVKAQKMRHDSLSFSVFGKIKLFEPDQSSKPLILYFTGDRGWNDSEKIIAMSLGRLGAPVAAIDTRHLEHELAKKSSVCVYPAANVEELSKLIQKKLGKKVYQYPVLAGHLSGSSWILALIAQAPQNTFAGALALCFCNKFSTSKPLCKGNGLFLQKTENENYTFLKATHLPEPVYIFQAREDKGCHAESVQDFVKDYKNISMTTLFQTSDNFENPETWIQPVKKAYESVIAMEDPFSAFLHASAKESGLPADLPLTFHPAKSIDTLPLCLMISGDGGWTGFDQSLAQELGTAGIPVCGLNALKYFWDKKDPASVAADISAIARYYLIKTGRKSLILLGYSFGADVLPFVYNKLPVELMKITHLLTLLSPSPVADFEIHYTDMLGVSNTGDKYDVFHEIRTIQKAKILCIYGSDEESDMFHPYLQKNVSVTIMSGGHHYDNSFDKIRLDIFKNLSSKN